MSIPVCFVDFLRDGCKRVRFRVNFRKDGRFTFSDPRERDTGNSGGRFRPCGHPSRDR